MVPHPLQFRSKAAVLASGESMDALQHPAGALLAIGVGQATAPLAIRERVAIVGEALEEFRRQLETVAAIELERASPRLIDLTEGEREAVESLTNRLTGAIIQPFVTRLRLAARTDPNLVQAATFFLGSDGDQVKDHIPIEALWIERP